MKRSEFTFENQLFPVVLPCKSFLTPLRVGCSRDRVTFSVEDTLVIIEDVSIDNEYEFWNEISDFAYCASVLCISTFSSRPVKLHYDEFSPKTRNHIRGLFVKLWPRAITLTYFWNVVLRDQSPAMLITSLLELASTLQMVHATKYVVLFRKNKLFLGEQITSRKFGKSTHKTYQITLFDFLIA